MEITRDAIMRVVKAARTAQKLADDIRKLTNDFRSVNVGDDIAGLLADALNMINGEKQGITDEFSDSRTYTWLFRSAMSDGEVTDEFIRMARENGPKIPKPNLISREQFDEMMKSSGGYRYTPEGEWCK